MALTHLPTRFSQYSDQPLGFVSTAEGFIFLSAFLVGRGYSKLLQENRLTEIRRRAWDRALRLYYWHLGLLVLVFAISAAFAPMIGRPGLKHLLSVYFANPIPAAVGATVLAYQPPLLDILPMYIVFLAATPAVLVAARREGWGRVLVLSALLWVLAQLDGRSLVFSAGAWLTGWPLPLESLGAFDWLAWQIVWIGGLAIGLNETAAKSALAEAGRRRIPLLSGACLLACVFFLWRHYGIGEGAYSGAIASAFDKWHLGALRIANFTALALLVNYGLLPLLRSPQFAWLAQLGRASLPVFCVHVVACVVWVGLVADRTSSSALTFEFLIIGSTFAAMYVAAMKANSTPGSSGGTPQGDVISRSRVQA